MSVDSHIQLPRSIIDSFSEKKPVVGTNGFINKADFVKVLSFGDDKIELIRTNDYGVENGYYTEDVEELLNKEFESPLGETRKKLIEFAKKKRETVKIDKNDFIVIKKYLKMLFYRNKFFYNLYLSESKIATSSNTSPSDYVQTCADLNVNPIDDFQRYSIAVVVKTGRRCFINNFTGFSFLSAKQISDKPVFFVPLSPECGIAFFLPKSNEAKDVYLDHLISNDDNTLDINKQIAITEAIYSKHSLIAKNESELVEVKEILNNVKYK